MRALILAFLFAQLAHMCAAQDSLAVGEIPFDSKLDNPKFRFCNEHVWQGYEVKTSQDETRRWISNHLKQRYMYKKEWSDQTGFITVRFAVNCLGFTDRFRTMGVDEDLKTYPFNQGLLSYLIQLTKDEKWPVAMHNQNSLDYYQRVIFKIVNGQLLEVIL